MTIQDEAQGLVEKIRERETFGNDGIQFDGDFTMHEVNAVALIANALAAREEFRKSVEVHFDMLCTEQIRAHAYADVTHDLDFQIFRVLSGYGNALGEIVDLKARLAKAKAKAQDKQDCEHCARFMELSGCDLMDECCVNHFEPKGTPVGNDNKCAKE